VLPVLPVLPVDELAGDVGTEQMLLDLAGGCGGQVLDDLQPLRRLLDREATLQQVVADAHERRRRLTCARHDLQQSRSPRRSSGISTTDTPSTAGWRR